jgi:hypothetical protein
MFEMFVATLCDCHDMLHITKQEYVEKNTTHYVKANDLVSPAHVLPLSSLSLELD